MSTAGNNAGDGARNANSDIDHYDIEIGLDWGPGAPSSGWLRTHYPGRENTS